MTFKVLLVGAGEINFGSVEGPWSHVCPHYDDSMSISELFAIVDPDTARAETALAMKLSGGAAASYSSSQIFGTIDEAWKSLIQDQRPRLAIIGAPPLVRGSDVSGHDLELRLVRAFPGCALFVEKPILVSVGYMLRYSAAVQKTKKIIRDNNLVIMGANARYIMAYECARKLSWWDKESSGGPIIEQATHFCDLSRYFGGDISLSSVTAHTVEHYEVPGKLTVKQFNEDSIPPGHRLPRLTNTSWKYANGAVGALTHAIALHGTTYDTEFEVYTDGYRLKLIDAYNAPVLSLRRPGISYEEVFRFPEVHPQLV